MSASRTGIAARPHRRPPTAVSAPIPRGAAQVPRSAPEPVGEAPPGRSRLSPLPRPRKRPGPARHHQPGRLAGPRPPRRWPQPAPGRRGTCSYHTGWACRAGMAFGPGIRAASPRPATRPARIKTECHQATPWPHPGAGTGRHDRGSRGRCHAAALLSWCSLRRLFCLVPAPCRVCSPGTGLLGRARPAGACQPELLLPGRTARPAGRSGQPRRPSGLTRRGPWSLQQPSLTCLSSDINIVLVQPAGPQSKVRCQAR